MTEFFEVVAKVAVLVFVVTCMVVAGLGLSVRDVVAPLRRVRLVALALVANFVIAPAVAWALTLLFALDQPYAIGLLLLAAAAGAPFLPKLAEFAKGDIAFSVGLMLLLTVGTVVFMPVIVPLLIPGQSVDTWPTLRSLVLSMLLPLGGGMAVRARSQRLTARLRPIFIVASNISVILAVVLLIGLNFDAVIGTFGSGVVAVAVVFVLILVAIGYAAGGPSPATRSVLALGTGQRNVAAALIVAAENSADARVVVMLLVATLAGLIVLVPAARWFAKRTNTTAVQHPVIPREPTPEAARA
ncbi:MAG TPA: bile acid:sodium symporter [Gemmataceae bacterium]|nr:bile acid:sodium symporter [Gemmataceae bacterium]